MNLSANIDRMNTEVTNRVFGLGAKLSNPLNLSIGQPDFSVHENIKEAIIKAIYDDKNGYTLAKGIIPLREAISEKWQNNGFTIDPNNIVVSAGVSSLLYFLFETLFNPHDEIMFIDPYFMIYDALAKYHQLKIHTIPENFTNEDLAKFKNNKNIKAIIFSTPSNPSGTILSKNQICQLSDLAKSCEALIISDEIYEGFDYNNKFVSTASIFPEGTITLNGCSKSYAMTGLRIGYMGVPENLAKIADKVASLQQYSVVCAPAPMQWGSIEALKTPVHNQITMMKNRRNIVKEALEGVSFYGDLDGAFYAFIQTPIDGMEFFEKAVQHNLLVMPGELFSLHKNHIRISYAVKEEILTPALALLKNLLITK